VGAPSRHGESALARLRAICLALPEAVERETWEIPTFRVRDRIFAMFAADGATPAVHCKAPPGAQEILLQADAARFFRPPYVGHKGWVGVRLGGGVDWDEVRQLLVRSYGMTAPRRLVALVDGEGSGKGSQWRRNENRGGGGG
jgi:predicted DNA-binding protein (MmcQ/YjbR family)